MTTHTPGPWFIPSSRGSNCRIAHTNGHVCFTAIPREIDEKRLTDESWLDMRARTAQEREAVKHEESANARLIAAAPDLLEALIDYRSQFGQALLAHGIEATPHQEQVEEQARFAIVKATQGIEDAVGG